MHHPSVGDTGPACIRLVAARSAAPAATAGSDAGDVRWVPLLEVIEALTDASVVRAVAKLRGRGGTAI